MTIANTPSTIISGNGLHQPWGLAFDASGQLWVASSGDDTVRQYSSDGTFLQSIIAGPVPAGLAVDQLGNVWVTSYVGGYVQEIDPSASSVIQTIPTPGGVLPTGLAFDASGDLWLSTLAGAGDIYESSGGLGFQLVFNAGGIGDNYDLEFDASGNLWISDFGNQTVQGFATDGTLIQTLGGFLGPSAIEFDSSGNLWVAEYWSNSIRSVSTVDGATIETVTGVINSPWGLAFDSEGDLWVSNYSLDQVQEYAYLRPSPIVEPSVPTTIQIGRFTAANEWAGSGLHDFPVANSYATINFSSQVAGFIGGITRSITVHDLSTMYQTTSTVSQAGGEHVLPFAKISESLLQEVLDTNSGIQPLHYLFASDFTGYGTAVVENHVTNVPEVLIVNNTPNQTHLSSLDLSDFKGLVIVGTGIDITGLTEANNAIVQGNATYTMSVGDEQLVLKGGGAMVNGGLGIDTVYFADDSQSRARVTEIADDRYIVSTAQGASILNDIERIRFNDGAIAFDSGAGEIAGEAYRLYQAAFGRTPDETGIGYWIDQLDSGNSLSGIAQQFLTSQEFQSTYGMNLNDNQFIDQLYQNVLHRGSDAEGYSYWQGILANGTNRADVLASFSESNENIGNTTQQITNGIQYQAWLG